MTTWHQRQRPIQWDHPTQWTVVHNPLHEFASCMTFTTKEAAEANIKLRAPKLRGGLYLLPPRSEPNQ